MLREVQEQNNEAYRDQQFAGLTEDEIQKVIAEFIERIRATGRYPKMLASCWTTMSTPTRRKPATRGSSSA